MKLKFHSRDGRTQPVPGTAARGQPREIVGRRLTVEGKSMRHVATAEPFECDADSALGAALKRAAMRGDIWCADAATAAFCGIEFQRLERDADGEWIAAKAPAPAPTKPSKSEPKAEL